MKTKNKILLLLLGVLFLGACKKNYLSIPYIDPNVPVSYSAQINPIWQTSCTSSSCHAAGKIPPNLVTDKSYASLVNGGFIDSTIIVPLNVILYQQLKGLNGLTLMPPTPLSTEQLNLISTWIIQGSKNN